MDGVGTPIIGRPRPLPSHDTPNPAHNTYTLKCEGRYYTVFYRTVSTGWTCEFCENTVLSLQFDIPHDLTYTVNKQYT